MPDVRNAGGLDALKVLGTPADVWRETKARMFAAWVRMKAAMKTEVRQTVTVKRGGVIEIHVPGLAEGETAEVIVRPGASVDRVREARELFDATQALPGARTVTEEEIAAEIRAWRTSRR